jgi:hypothetical protein
MAGNRDEVGEVCYVGLDAARVNFPSHEYWLAALNEIELAGPQPLFEED